MPTALVILECVTNVSNGDQIVHFFISVTRDQWLKNVARPFPHH